MKIAVICLVITLVTLTECQEGLKKKILKKVIKNGHKLDEILNFLKDGGCCCESKEEGKVILVSGGYGNSTTSEVLDSDGNHICWLSNLNSTRFAQSQFDHTACGGSWVEEHQKTCDRFHEGHWKQLPFDLLEQRYTSPVWHRPDGHILIAGYYTDTSERILNHDAGTVASFPTIEASFSCGIDVDENNMIITGGRSGDKRVVSIDSYGDFTYLPELQTGRWGHACGYYTNDYGDKVLLVVGGHEYETGSLTPTTEYLTLGENSWYYANDYPLPASMPVAVTIYNRVICMGGYNDGGVVDETYIYNPDTQSWDGPGYMGAGRQAPGASIVREDTVLPYCLFYPPEDFKSGKFNQETNVADKPPQ